MEDVESNPRPYANVLRTTRHQGHEKYAHSAGRQCTAITYFLIIFLVRKIPSRWGVFNLDYILNEGDQIYKSAVTKTALLVEELPLQKKFRESSIFGSRNF